MARNTITLNGKSSDEITGLLIQELPAISKPAIRTEVETIDGRDGDIITKLGYSAYDKELSIGLYGSYDLNEIIEFFNSEGEVIFSNEEEFVYKYAIYEAIDFERLVRFRTAKVKMHVQPFKFSLEESARSFSANPLSIPDFTQTKNGVTAAVASGVLTVAGTATAASEFYIPISALTLEKGNYTLRAATAGENAGNVAIRLIKDSPSNANSFGGKPVYLSADAPVYIEAALDEAKSYNYLWVYATTGAAINLSSTVSLKNDAGISITNNGNIYSRPLMTLVGTGTVNLSVNGEQLFVVNFGDTENSITIDTALMEAYYGTPEALANRAVDGDYDNFRLKVGVNTITWSGDLRAITLSDYSRWI